MRTTQEDQPGRLGLRPFETRSATAWKTSVKHSCSEAQIGWAHNGNGRLWLRSPELGKVVRKPERQPEVLLSERPGAIGLLNGL